MLCRELIASSSDVCTKHVNGLCWQNVEYRMSNFVVQKVATGILIVKNSHLISTLSHVLLN